MQTNQTLSISNGSVWAQWSCRLALATLFVVPIASAGLLPQAALAQYGGQHQLAERVLTVTGQGIIEIPTTITQVNLGVVVQAKTAADAQTQAAQQSNAVVDWVRSQNVDNLQTTGISLSPQYDYSGNRQSIIGYQATNNISFQLATERAGAVMDEAVRVGATQINRVSFVAEDDAIAAARQEALQAAITDAQQQADAALSSLGLSRQEIVNILIGSVSAPPPVDSVQLISAEAAPRSPVIGQDQSISARVTLHIRY